MALGIANDDVYRSFVYRLSPELRTDLEMVRRMRKAERK